MLGGDKIIVRGDPQLQKDMAEGYRVQVQRAGTNFTSWCRTGRNSWVVADFSGRIRSIQVKEPSLDDVFLHLTGRAIRNEEGSPDDAAARPEPLQRALRKGW
jgi:ABC-2 type transport system ATP-binding protein